MYRKTYWRKPTTTDRLFDWGLLHLVFHDYTPEKTLKRKKNGKINKEFYLLKSRRYWKKKNK